MNKNKPQDIKISGIINFVRQGIKHNKKTVTIPKSNWELIEAILKKVKIVVPNL